MSEKKAVEGLVLQDGISERIAQASGKWYYTLTREGKEIQIGDASPEGESKNKMRHLKNKLPVAALIVSLMVTSLAGCGTQAAGTDDATAYQDTEYVESTYHESVPEEEAGSSRYFDTENVLPSPAEEGAVMNPGDPGFYADESAVEHARETDSLAYLEWLSDYCVNVVEPQVVEMLMRIPLFAEAASDGLLSKYIALGLTYNDVNQFGAITLTSYLDKEGRTIEDDGESEIPNAYNVAYRICVNTYIYDEKTMDDPAKQKELQDTMLHEMMHAVMEDYIRNGETGMFADGSFADRVEDTNAFPSWFSEGSAITIQCGYYSTREEMLGTFMDLEEKTREEKLETLSDPEEMYQTLAYFRDSMTEEEWDEIESETGLRNILPTDLRVEGNQYLSTYYGTMYLYYLSALHMGLEPFDEDGTLDMEIMMEGMENIMRKLHEGYSLSQLVAEISEDPETGEPLYEDLTAYEEAFLNGADEPGMIFVQKMLYDFESRITDEDAYIPTGSVIPGLNNYKAAFMDEDPRGVPAVYAVIRGLEDSSCNYFAISTVRPSDVALTGGRMASYTDVPGLSETEREDRDTLAIGDEAVLIDLTWSDAYESPNDWVLGLKAGE